MNNKIEVKDSDNLLENISKGNEAIAKSDIKKCIKYYKKALKKAIEINDIEKTNEIYHLLITL